MTGRVGGCVEIVDVERVLPVATTKEKRLRFEWERMPSAEFRMMWNQFMEPNSMFVEALDETGLTVTVRWGLMEQPPEKIRDLINAWLEKTERGQFRRSGIGGRRLTT
jgi:hypothetical protein